VRGPVAGLSRAWERIAAARCDRIVCVSHAELRLGVQAGLAPAWEVVPTGVDLARFRPAGRDRRDAARAAVAAPAGPLAVCVGRLSEAKGQDVLTRLWPQVRTRAPGAQLALVGDGELRPLVSSLAGEGVHLLGARSDVSEWYAAADVVVVPSRWDALSLSLAEAAASGCCVVATDAPGAREVLGDGGERGAVVPLGDDAALVTAIAQRLTDPALAAREAAALGAWARQHLDRTRTYDALAALVERLVAERDSAGAMEQ
jgi:glycosyltransferase involved in cell wall biosynthesis